MLLLLKLYFNDGTTLVTDRRKFNPEIFKMCGGVYIEIKGETWLV